MSATFRDDLFAGKRVLVLGGSSGIGAAIARAFRDHGGEVIATGRTDWEIAGCTDLEQITLEPLDLDDGDRLERRIRALPGLDILVVTAGLIRRRDEHDPAVFAHVLAVNLTGTMRALVAAHPLLAARRGAALTIGSVYSFQGAPLAPAYAASKGGIAQLTKSLAIAWAPSGVRLNALAPGWIRTPLTAAVREDKAREQAILARTPMARWGEPADVAGAALFLCSPAADFITGTILPVDGGYLVT